MLGSLIRNTLFVVLLIVVAQFSFAQTGAPADAASGKSKPATPPAIPRSTPAPEATGESQPSKVTLDYKETLFSVFAALNACGYNVDLNESDPVRQEIRNEVRQAIDTSAKAASATKEICDFYRDHQQPDSAQNVAQYVSLALNLDEPPKFATKLREADMPPDASYVLGFVPLLRNFYEDAGLHGIWMKHQREYERIIESLQEPIANTILATEVYLKIPISGYQGRQFLIYVEPMDAPAHVNARNYGADYFIVMAPEHGTVNLAQIRHTYLHFLLDPLALKRGEAMKRLSPLLKDVQTAPLDDSFKRDISLLVTESLIRAIEAHLVTGKAAEPQRQQLVTDSMTSGYILTRYFYDQLSSFANDPAGINSVYPDWLYSLDVSKEHKRASQITFSSRPAPEVLSTVAEQRKDPLDQAEQKLGEGDVPGAQKLAQEVLDQKPSDPARALFILGQVATMNRDVDGAVNYFEQTIQASKEPRLTAWSHIYLGRIYDMQDDRDAAVQQYKAALLAGDEGAMTKAAAERGLKQPFHAPQQGNKQEQ